MCVLDRTLFFTFYLTLKVDWCPKHKHHHSTYPVDTPAEEQKLWLKSPQRCVISHLIVCLGM